MRDHEVRGQRPGERFPRQRELAWRLAELAAGADDYFTKPFSPLALLNMVERVRHTQAGAD